MNIIYVLLLIIAVIVTAPLVALLCAVTHPDIIIPKIQRSLDRDLGIKDVPYIPVKPYIAGGRHTPWSPPEFAYHPVIFDRATGGHIGEKISFKELRRLRAEYGTKILFEAAGNCL